MNITVNASGIIKEQITDDPGLRPWIQLAAIFALIFLFLFLCVCCIYLKMTDRKNNMPNYNTVKKKVGFMIKKEPTKEVSSMHSSLHDNSSMTNIEIAESDIDGLLPERKGDSSSSTTNRKKEEAIFTIDPEFADMGEIEFDSTTTINKTGKEEEADDVEEIGNEHKS
jgi:hypothetical protein